MKRKKKTKANYDRPTTVIGKDTLIQTAVIESQKSIQVNGKVIGDLKIDESVVVGQVGHVEGNIESLYMLVAGRITGNVYVKEQIHLTKTAVVSGDIICKSIIIDDGAKIDGSFNMTEQADDSFNKKSIKELETA